MARTNGSPHEHRKGCLRTFQVRKVASRPCHRRSRLVRCPPTITRHPLLIPPHAHFLPSRLAQPIPLSPEGLKMSTYAGKAPRKGYPPTHAGKTLPTPAKKKKTVVRTRQPVKARNGPRADQPAKRTSMGTKKSSTAKKGKQRATEQDSEESAWESDSEVMVGPAS